MTSAASRYQSGMDSGVMPRGLPKEGHTAPGSQLDASRQRRAPLRRLTSTRPQLAISLWTRSLRGPASIRFAGELASGRASKDNIGAKFGGLEPRHIVGEVDSAATTEETAITRVVGDVQ